MAVVVLVVPNGQKTSVQATLNSVLGAGVATLSVGYGPNRNTTTHWIVSWDVDATTLAALQASISPGFLDVVARKGERGAIQARGHVPFIPSGTPAG